MADSKITALTSISTSSDPANDPLVIVDVSDTSMAATGTTKKVTLNQLLATSPTATLASATITGDLTVDTSTLKVDSANDRVGIGTASPAAGAKLGVTGATVVSTSDYIGSSTWAARFTGSSNGASSGISFFTNSSSGFPTPASIHATPIADYRSALVATYSADSSGAGYFAVNRSSPIGGNTLEHYKIDNTGVATWSNVGGVAGTAMTLNSTGLGLGVTPSAWGASLKAFELGAKGNALFTTASVLDGLFMVNNAYYDTSYKYASTGYASRYTHYQGAHQWFTAPSGTAGNAITFTQAMTLAATGNLLVGTTTDIAAVRMQVWSADANNTAYFRNSNATTPYGPSVKYTAATPNNTGSEFLYCEDSTAVRVALRSNGGIANYQANNVSLSDSRMKSDIKPLGSYWNKIKSLEVVTFKYNDQTHSDDNIGLIAQQVESVAPELVDVDGFGETPVDGVPLKTIYTTDLYHASIKALQEAMSRIEALEAKLA